VSSEVDGFRANERDALKFMPEEMRAPIAEIAAIERMNWKSSETCSDPFHDRQLLSNRPLEHTHWHWLTGDVERGMSSPILRLTTLPLLDRRSNVTLHFPHEYLMTRILAGIFPNDKTS
jgi:hypothetical protein